MTSRDDRAERLLVLLAGVLGALAVGLGAYGAHGLERALEGLPDAAKRLGWWETAVLYHLAHAPALGIAAWLTGRARSMTVDESSNDSSRSEGQGPRAPRVVHRRFARVDSARIAGIFFVAGVLLFCGTLYAMALGAPRWLGAVTPIGGLSLMLGWALVALAGVRRSRVAP